MTTPASLTVAEFHASRRFADTRFGRIAYIERGSGPAALFLHGFPLNGFQWRGALPRLAGLRRCLAPDFMGLGHSEVPESQSLSPQAQTDMLVALLDVLGIDAVDLIGNDSGGAIAQLFAVQHPTRVRSLLLTNCDVHEDSPPALLEPMLQACRAGVYADKFIVPQLNDTRFARSSQGLGGLAYTNPENFTDASIECYLRPLVSSALRKQQFHGYVTALVPNPLLAIEPALERLTVPLRVVWGTGDFIFKASWAEWLDRKCPQSRGVRRVEGAKLFFPEEMPDLIAEEARELWR